MTNSLLIHGAAIATVDEGGTEYDQGWVLVVDGRIDSLGDGAPDSAIRARADRQVDAAGMLLTPGLVNCHHHLCQHLTRGYAQDKDLFGWLTELYPIWRHMNEDGVRAAAGAGLAQLVTSGCTLATDHHYLHPRGGGDMLAAEIGAAVQLGLRFHPTRGSMDLGASQGGLPPDEVVETTDAILAATHDAVSRFHDSSPDSKLQIAIAPCSPFSVTETLMTESATLARAHGLRLHTHLAETIEEEAFCLERFGCRPVEYLEKLGWLGDDVWLAHCVHLSDAEVAQFGATGTGVSHCPSSNARLGAGIARVADLTGAGAPVGLGVDGAASNESGELSVEVREALLVARLRGDARSMDARDALSLGTMGGARCLGRENDLGSIEPGKLADLVLWDLSGIGHAGIADPVCALVFGPPRRAAYVFVQGEAIVYDHQLLTANELDLARELSKECDALEARAASDGIRPRARSAARDTMEIGS